MKDSDGCREDSLPFRGFQLKTSPQCNASINCGESSAPLTGATLRDYKDRNVWVEFVVLVLQSVGEQTRWGGVVLLLFEVCEAL